MSLWFDTLHLVPAGPQTVSLFTSGPVVVMLYSLLFKSTANYIESSVIARERFVSLVALMQDLIPLKAVQP